MKIYHSAVSTVLLLLVPLVMLVDVASATNYVVTLGDSYSSGTGIHRDGDEYDTEYGGNACIGTTNCYQLTARSDDECWREENTTPGPRYAASHSMGNIFLACKGAEIDHVQNQFEYLMAHPSYQTEVNSNWAGSIIVVTAGGNDIRTNEGKDWPSLLEHCILETNLFKGCDDMSKNQISNFPAIKTGLSAMYKDMCSRASAAKIRVLGYPKVMQRDPGCGSVTGVGRDEADWMDDQVVELNNKIYQAVYEARAHCPGTDIQYVQVYNYLTVGACGDGADNRHVHDKRLHNYFPYGTSDSSFHPSQLGYDAYHAALSASL